MPRSLDKRIKIPGVNRHQKSVSMPYIARSQSDITTKPLILPETNQSSEVAWEAPNNEACDADDSFCAKSIGYDSIGQVEDLLMISKQDSIVNSQRDILQPADPCMAYDIATTNLQYQAPQSLVSDDPLKCYSVHCTPKFRRKSSII